MIARDTIEEKVVALARRKAALFSGVIAVTSQPPRSPSAERPEPKGRERLGRRVIEAAEAALAARTSRFARARDGLGALCQ